MNQATPISVYANQEFKTWLENLAEAQGRSVSKLARRMIENSLDNLTLFDRAVLSQVGKDEGLEDLLEAVSFIIREYQRLASLEQELSHGQIQSVV